MVTNNTRGKAHVKGGHCDQYTVQSQPEPLYRVDIRSPVVEEGTVQ